MTHDEIDDVDDGGFGRESDAADRDAGEGSTYELGVAKEFRAAVEEMERELREYVRERIGVEPRSAEWASRFATCETWVSGAALVTDVQELKFDLVKALVGRYGDATLYSVELGKIGQFLTKASRALLAVEATCGAAGRYFAGESALSAITDEAVETGGEMIFFDYLGDYAAPFLEAASRGAREQIGGPNRPYSGEMVP